ncbi:DUF5719 family protein [Aquihabitans sp. McL0605]|uniref:DUF5719 family protein n=1 Tax=Aquihabitans sp. McL0605 TaxID=3415671 RepID=UPI003CE98688
MARRSIARRRRSRRFTPRRWLPFVALSALVVGAVMVSSEQPPAGPAAGDASLDVARLPAVTSTDAISSAWYCAGGTATGKGGTAELSVVMANDATRGAVAEVTVTDEAGKHVTQQVDVPANGRARVVASDILKADWVGVLVEVRGGRVAVDREVTGPLGFDSSPCSTEASGHWYVPSGSTLRGAEEYLSLFNPFPDSASVSVAFATDTGRRTPRALRALSIPGRSVRVVKVSDDITNRAAIAATVTARAGRVVVDRVQTYDGSGDPLVGSAAGSTSSPAPKGLVSTAASPVRGPRWIFAGARVSPDVRTQIVVFNPGTRTAEVDVDINYEEPKVHTSLEPAELTIRPGEQAIVDLTDISGIVPDTDLWIDVRSLTGVPVVAERLSFFGSEARTGATATLGSPLAATGWMVTQGGATDARSTTVQVVNPGTSSAEVTAFVLSGGTRTELKAAATTVPGGDRRTLVLDGAGSSATVIVQSTKPVVVASSIAIAGGLGISVQPAFPYPETVVALPPIS